MPVKVIHRFENMPMSAEKFIEMMSPEKMELRMKWDKSKSDYKYIIRFYAVVVTRSSFRRSGTFCCSRVSMHACKGEGGRFSSFLEMIYGELSKLYVVLLLRMGSESG